MVAIELITEHIRTKLGQHALRRVYPNLEVLQSSFQTRGMHTALRDTATPKNNFVFMADRLIRLVSCGVCDTAARALLGPSWPTASQSGERCRAACRPAATALQPQLLRAGPPTHHAPAQALCCASTRLSHCSLVLP